MMKELRSVLGSGRLILGTFYISGFPHMTVFPDQ